MAVNRKSLCHSLSIVLCAHLFNSVSSADSSPISTEIDVLLKNLSRETLIFHTDNLPLILKADGVRSIRSLIGTKADLFPDLLREKQLLRALMRSVDLEDEVVDRLPWSEQKALLVLIGKFYATGPAKNYAEGEGLKVDESHDQVLLGLAEKLSSISSSFGTTPLSMHVVSEIAMQPLQNSIAQVLLDSYDPEIKSDFYELKTEVVLKGFSEEKTNSLIAESSDVPSRLLEFLTPDIAPESFLIVNEGERVQGEAVAVTLSDKKLKPETILQQQNNTAAQPVLEIPADLKSDKVFSSPIAEKRELPLKDTSDVDLQLSLSTRNLDNSALKSAARSAPSFSHGFSMLPTQRELDQQAIMGRDRLVVGYGTSLSATVGESEQMISEEEPLVTSTPLFESSAVERGGVPDLILSENTNLASEAAVAQTHVVKDVAPVSFLDRVIQRANPWMRWFGFSGFGVQENSIQAPPATAAAPQVETSMPAEDIIQASRAEPVDDGLFPAQVMSSLERGSVAQLPDLPELLQPPQLICRSPKNDFSFIQNELSQQFDELELLHASEVFDKANFDLSSVNWKSDFLDSLKGSGLSKNFNDKYSRVFEHSWQKLENTQIKIMPCPDSLTENDDLNKSVVVGEDVRGNTQKTYLAKVSAEEPVATDRASSTTTTTPIPAPTPIANADGLSRAQEGAASTSSNARNLVSLNREVAASAKSSVVSQQHEEGSLLLPPAGAEEAFASQSSPLEKATTYYGRMACFARENNEVVLHAQNVKTCQSNFRKRFAGVFGNPLKFRSSEYSACLATAMPTSASRSVQHLDKVLFAENSVCLFEGARPAETRTELSELSPKLGECAKLDSLLEPSVEDQAKILTLNYFIDDRFSSFGSSRESYVALELLFNQSKSESMLYNLTQCSAENEWARFVLAQEILYRKAAAQVCQSRESSLIYHAVDVEQNASLLTSYLDMDQTMQMNKVGELTLSQARQPSSQYFAPSNLLFEENISSSSEVSQASCKQINARYNFYLGLILNSPLRSQWIKNAIRDGGRSRASGH
jgi:hypothetical protein